jgi:predicted RNA-binding protein with PIN domain
MAPIYLIDGYNLIHALGLLRKRLAPGELEDARGRLLEMLEERQAGLGAMTVVFDAKRKPRRGASDEMVGGVRVLYAVGREADELLEELIARESQAARLRVVSDDHRIQQAATRAGATALGCQSFLDRLEQPSLGAAKPAPARPASADDAAPLTPAELRHWLKEFADVEIPKELRDTFDEDDRGVV